MSKEDGRVTPLPERLYSIGPGLAGIIDERNFAFEVRDGGGGDVFVSVGKFGPPGAVKEDGQVFFDLPSVVNGGGKHPHTSSALHHLRETIVNYGQTPLSEIEKIPGPPFDANFVSLNGNYLNIRFFPFWMTQGARLTIIGVDDKEGIYTCIDFFKGEEPQRKFAGIISAFRRLAKAIREDNRLLFGREDGRKSRQ